MLDDSHRNTLNWGDAHSIQTAYGTGAHSVIWEHAMRQGVSVDALAVPRSLLIMLD